MGKVVEFPNYHVDEIYLINDHGVFEKYKRTTGHTFVATGDIYSTLKEDTNGRVSDGTPTVPVTNGPPNCS